MPDFRHLIRERLGPLDVPADREAEIVAEMAEHLEDRGEAAAGSGSVPDLEIQATLGEVSDWPAFRREIRRAEEDPMNERTRNLWLPGVATLFLYAFVLRLVIWTGVQPNVFWLAPPNHLFGGSSMAVILYLPWLILLPVIGGLGAWWSRRSGGAIATRLLTGIFPVIAVFGFLLAVFVFLAPFVDRQVPLQLKLAGLVMYLVVWVLIPGAALVLGALPFLRNHGHKAA